MVYRANERLRFTVPCILYLLVVGDSGSGKSKARTIVYKALTLMLKQLEAAEHPQDAGARIGRATGGVNAVSRRQGRTGRTDSRDVSVPSRRGMHATREPARAVATLVARRAGRSSPACARVPRRV